MDALRNLCRNISGNEQASGNRIGRDLGRSMGRKPKLRGDLQRNDSWSLATPIHPIDRISPIVRQLQIRNSGAPDMHSAVLN